MEGEAWQHVGHTWGIDNKQARQFEIALLAVGSQGLCALEQGVFRNIGGANLLRDTTGFTILHVCAPHVVENLGFPCTSSGLWLNRQPEPRAPLRTAFRNVHRKQAACLVRQCHGPMARTAARIWGCVTVAQPQRQPSNHWVSVSEQTIILNRNMCSERWLQTMGFCFNSTPCFDQKHGAVRGGCEQLGSCFKTDHGGIRDMVQ